MNDVNVEVKIKIPINLDLLAQAFADMNDDEQTQFFVKVAEIAKTWDNKWGGAQSQWINIGGHLRNCQCSSDAARDMIRDIAWALDNSNHGKEKAA